MSKKLCVILGIMLITVLVGCGGGGGGGTDAGQTPGAEDSNANLARLVISTGTIVFNPDVTSYNVEVDNTISSFTITPTLANTEARILINGTEVESGQTFGPVNLAEGTNPFEIRITATNGSTSKSYEIVVTRQAPAEKSHNADLAGLVLSAGVLSPSFNAGTTSYTAEVVNEVSSITVTPLAAGVNTSIKVNGLAVVSGNVSASVNLSVGDNPITVVVTAEDGVTIKNYTVTLKRLAGISTDANLSNMTISQGILNPSFKPATVEYTAQVAYAISKLTVTPTSASAKASIKVNGNTVASGSPALAVDLVVGVNSIPIVVTAENGTDKTYTLNVTRLNDLSPNALLSNLSISQGTLAPVFISSTINYTAQVLNTTASITVTPTAAGVGASITVNGTSVTSGINSPAINLIVGENTITVLVTAQDGITKKTYTVKVTRASEGFTTAPQFLHYTLPDQYNFLTNYPGKTVADEPVILFSAYTLTEGILYKDGITLVSGYALGQFVDKDKVNASTPDPDGVLGANDARKLYSVVVRSNQDGFTNRTKFVGSGLYNADLRWDQYILGYLLDLNYSGRTYFPDSNIDVANMYNNKYAYDIYMFRKIDIKRPDADGSLVTFEPQATTDSYVNDTTYTTATTLTTTKFTVSTKSFGTYSDVKAISLVQFLTDYVTDSPGFYTYKIVAVDDTFKEGWTYADMQQAYYLVDYDLIIRLDASNNIISGTKINFPVRIELISGSIVEYDYSAKNPPAFAKAY